MFITRRVEKLIAPGRQLLRLLPFLPKEFTLTGKNNKSAEKDLPKRSDSVNSNDVACKL